MMHSQPLLTICVYSILVVGENEALCICGQKNTYLYPCICFSVAVCNVSSIPVQ